MSWIITPKDVEFFTTKMVYIKILPRSIYLLHLLKSSFIIFKILNVYQVENETKNRVDKGYISFCSTFDFFS